jgi:hypothetical protein
MGPRAAVGIVQGVDDPGRVHRRDELDTELAGADLTTGAPKSVRAALGVPSNQEGKLNYLYGLVEQGKLADVAEDKNGELFIKIDKSAPWLKVNPYGPDWGDVAEGVPGAAQAGLSGLAGVATANPLVAGTVDAGIEGLRQVASEAMGASENMSTGERAARIAGTGVAGVISQGGSNIIARGVQQMRPRNIIARQIAEEGRNPAAAPSPDKLDLQGPDQIVGLKGKPTPSQQVTDTAKAIGGAVTKAATAVGRGAKAVGKAFMGVDGNAGALKEGLPLAEQVGSEAARRIALLKKHGITDATVAQKTGSDLAYGLEDLVRESKGASRPLDSAYQKSLAQFRDAARKAIGATGDPRSAEKAGLELQVRTKNLIKDTSDDIDENSRKIFGELHKRLKGRPIFDYQSYRAALKKEIKKLGVAGSTTDTAARGALENLLKEVTFEGSQKAVNSMAFENTVQGSGRAVGKLKDLFGDVRPKEAERIAKRLYASLMDDFGKAQETNIKLYGDDNVGLFMDARQAFKTDITKLEKLKTGLLAEVTGFMQKRPAAGETVIKTLVGMEPSEIRRTMKLIKRIDSGLVLDTRAAAMEEWLETTRDFASLDEALLSVRKVATKIGKDDKKLLAFYNNDPAALARIKEIGELANIMATPQANSATFRRMDMNRLVGAISDYVTGNWADGSIKMVDLFNKRRMAYMLASPDLQQSFLRIVKFPKEGSAAVKTALQRHVAEFVNKLVDVTDDTEDGSQSGEAPDR